MKSVNVKAKNFETALEEAIEKLGCNQEDVDFDEISAGGIFKKGEWKFTIKADAVQVKETKLAPVKEEVEKPIRTEQGEQKPKMHVTPEQASAVRASSLPKEARASSRVAEGLHASSASAPRPAPVSSGEGSGKLDKCVEFVNGLLGAGGGLVLLLFLKRSLKLDTHKAHATSVAVMLPLSVLSALIYIGQTEIPWNMALWLSLGGAIGGYLGARVLKRIKPRHLGKILGAVLIISAIRMIF